MSVTVCTTGNNMTPDLLLSKGTSMASNDLLFGRRSSHLPQPDSLTAVGEALEICRVTRSGMGTEMEPVTPVVYLRGG